MNITDLKLPNITDLEDGVAEGKISEMDLGELSEYLMNDLATLRDKCAEIELLFTNIKILENTFSGKVR